MSVLRLTFTSLEPTDLPIQLPHVSMYVVYLCMYVLGLPELNIHAQERTSGNSEDVEVILQVP